MLPKNKAGKLAAQFRTTTKTQMKPFNLEEFKAGRLAIRRDGIVARFEAYVADAEEGSRLVYSALSEHNIRYLYVACQNGNYFNEGNPVSECDLIGMATTKRTVWANFWADGSARWYGSAEDAEKEVRRIATHVAIEVEVPVEIDE